MVRRGQQKASLGTLNLADKLHRLGTAGAKEVSDEVLSIAGEANERVVDIVTSEIEPHSGLHRKRNPQAVVTDLVDTGAYRAGWGFDSLTAFKSRVFNVTDHGIVLEYGSDDGTQPAFEPLQRTHNEYSPVFYRRMNDVIRKYMK